MDLFLGLLFLTYLFGGMIYSISVLGRWVDNGRTPTNGNIVTLFIFLPQTIITFITVLIFVSINKIFVLIRKHFPKLVEWWRKPIKG